MQFISPELFEDYRKMKKKILLIDDARDSALVLKDFLDDQGYEADVAFNAKSALKMFSAGKYQLIITDYKLPDSDGLKLIKQFSAQDSRLKVIFLTGYKIRITTGKDRQILEKPAKPSHILTLIKKMI